MMPLIINPLIISLLSPLCIGIIRKMKAYFQNRRGASVWQPYYNLIKLFHKDEVVSKDASWIFRHAPMIVFGTTLALAAGIPIFGASFVFTPMNDILVFVCTLALGTFFLALAGIDVGSGFGGFGASREMTIAALAEGGLVLALVATTIVSGTAHVGASLAPVSNLHTLSLLALILAAIAFFIILLAENARFPFDNPSTHLELTMVHEAMILEYSGKRLALMEWAAANKLLIFMLVFANVFLPLGVTVFSFATLGILVVKLLAVMIGITFIESLAAKFRFFRLPDLLLTSFVLAVIAISIIVL